MVGRMSSVLRIHLHGSGGVRFQRHFPYIQRGTSVSDGASGDFHHAAGRWRQVQAVDHRFRDPVLRYFGHCRVHASFDAVPAYGMER